MITKLPYKHINLMKVLNFRKYVSNKNIIFTLITVFSVHSQRISLYTVS